MAYLHHQNENPAEATKRTLRDSINDSLKSLTDRKLTFDEKVHQSRKELKRVRALLRLVRESLGEKTFQTENANFREIGARLSAVRDAHVLPQTLAKLVKKSTTTISALKRGLEDEAERTSTQVKSETANLKTTVEELREARGRIDSLELTGEGWDAYREGLEKTYRRGRKARDAAFATTADEDFHEWRKNVKTLRHQLQFLKQCWEPELTLSEKLLHKLSDFLGEDHDLAVLRDYLRARGNDDEALFRRIEDRQASLRRQAGDLGQRIYAEKPKAFERRLRVYWQAWEASPRP